MKRKINIVIILLVVLSVLSGCGFRVRIPENPKQVYEETEERKQDEEEDRQEEKKPEEKEPEQAEPEKEDEKQDEKEEKDEQTDEPEIDDPDAVHVEDSTSEHKEYSDEADAETGDSDRVIVDMTAEAEAEEGIGEESGEAGEFVADAVMTESEQNQSIIVEESAEDAPDYGVDETAPEADSSLVFYMTLLKKLDNSLFECKKFYTYVETSTDYRTIHKSSSMHETVLLSAAYDVSSKLTEETLDVDDGWVKRKNPGAVVKLVASDVLGKGIDSDASARAVFADIVGRSEWNSMDAVKRSNVLLLSEELFDTECGRLAAAVCIAKVLYPEQMSDVDPEEAMKEIYTEAMGRFDEGIYMYYPENEESAV